MSDNGRYSNKMLMFVYGVLVNDDMRFNVLGRSTTSYPANLYNYEVVTHSYAHYPTIKRKIGSITKGILFNMCDKDLVKLDRYENNLYDRIIVEVNHTQCFVYIERKIIPMTETGKQILDHLNDRIFDSKIDIDELI